MSDRSSSRFIRDLLMLAIGAAAVSAFYRYIESRRIQPGTQLGGGVTFREERLLDITDDEDPLEGTVIVAEGLDPDMIEDALSDAFYDGELDELDEDKEEGFGFDELEPDPDESDNPTATATETLSIVDEAAAVVADAAEDLSAAEESDLIGADEPQIPSGPLGVAPVEGECPLTHPIKARFSTGRYYAPGDEGYERMFADRCYATPVEAEADGFTQAV